MQHKQLMSISTPTCAAYAACMASVASPSFSAWAWIVCQRTHLNSRAFSFNAQVPAQCETDQQQHDAACLHAWHAERPLKGQHRGPFHRHFKLPCIYGGLPESHASRKARCELGEERSSLLAKQLQFDRARRCARSLTLTPGPAGHALARGLRDKKPCVHGLHPTPPAGLASLDLTRSRRAAFRGTLPARAGRAPTPPSNQLSADALRWMRAASREVVEGCPAWCCVVCGPGGTWSSTCGFGVQKAQQGF